MQIISRLCIAFGLVWITTLRLLRTASAEAASDPVIEVRAYNQAGVSTETLERAQREVSFIFKRIGVNAQWVPQGEPHFRFLIVERLAATLDYRAELFGYTPRDADGNTGGLAYVAYGSIREFIRNSVPGRPQLNPADMLAYCIAHEIGHLLLPAGFHSAAGIMRARWRENDFKLIATGRLFFTDEQANLMRQQVLRLTQQR
jgi:hypothetical protein